MGQTRIDVMVSKPDIFGSVYDGPARKLKVRKVEFDGDGQGVSVPRPTGKWLLSFEIGEWIQVAWGPMRKGTWARALPYAPQDCLLPLNEAWPGPPRPGEMPKRRWESATDYTWVNVAVSDGVLRLRRLELVGGRIASRHGLSFVTGEWVEVAEGERYPDECLTPWRDEADDVPG